MVPYKTPMFNRMRVVLPVCQKDCSLMLANLQWQYELDGRKQFDCVISADSSLPDSILNELIVAAYRTFSTVDLLVYETAPNTNWPNGPNWAFQQTARFMQDGKRAWFWMEPDCIPLCPGWLTVWNDAYFSQKRPIMGVVVEGMGHCNGTAVYPAKFPRICRAAMNCTDLAWDGEMRDETIGITYNAAHLLCHVWGIKNGKAMPFGGDPAHFETWEDVERWVNSEAILLHRCKDTSLIEQLRKHA